MALWLGRQSYNREVPGSIPTFGHFRITSNILIIGESS